VAASILASFAGLCALGVVRYDHYLAGRFDLGNMVQAVWSTAHGRPLDVTLASGEQTVRLAAHADIFLAALAPLWVVFPSPLLLVVVQAAALALGALPVFWLARKHIRSDWGAVLMVWAYLLYPWLVWGQVNDFHSITVGSCFLLFAIWALDSDRLVFFAVFAVAALTTHELVGLLVAGLGVWYALARGRRRAGAVIAAGGLAWTALFLGVVIPHFAEGQSPFYGRFASTGGSPGGILETALQDPLTILRAVTSGEDIVYLMLLVFPLAFMLVFAPGIALASSALVAMNLLSDWPTTTNPKFQYTTPLIPFLIAATIFGVARFSPGRARGAAIVVAFSALLFIVAGPTKMVLGYEVPAAEEAALKTAIGMVPDEAAVSSTQLLGGRLSARRVIYSFPVFREADWVVVDRTDTWVPELPTVREGFSRTFMNQQFERLERDPRFRLVFEQGEIEVYRRVGS
jgi:uncharacterized membrane protein